MKETEGSIVKNGTIRNFSIDLIENFIEDSDPEFAYGTMVFLSTKPNSHELDISEDVLRECASSILGKWVVCRVNPYTKEAEGHSPLEVIVGQVPKDQEIKFSYDKDGYLLASADFILSKIYAVDTYNLFKNGNFRNVSVEMLTSGTIMADGREDEKDVSHLSICGVTILGKRINGSCPGANAQLVQFEEKVTEFYENHHINELEALKKFAEEGRKAMADKTYRVDKSKDAMSDTPWGEVNKEELRKKIMEASNKASLVKDVYMVVEDGWEDAPSEKLKYPVMQFKGDTLVYNKGGLSSALGYAKAENDSAVVSKVEKIRKDLDIEDENNDNDKNKNGKERKMATAQFEIEGREAWGEIIKKVQSHEGKGVYVDSVEKDHIIFTKDDIRYRVDADVKVGKDDKTVDAEIHWGTKKKDKVQKMSKKSKLDDDEDDEDEDDNDEDEGGEGHSDEDEDKKHRANLRKCSKFIEKLSSDANVDASAYMEMLEKEAKRNKALAEKLAEKDHIIMEHDKELKELRKFKEDKDKERVEMEVSKTMEEVKEFVDKESFETLKSEGMACKMEAIDGWKNKARSIAFEKSHGKSQKFSSAGLWRMGAPITEPHRKSGLWED